MKDSNVINLEKPEGKFHDHLTEILRQGCTQILKEALEIEIEAFIEGYRHFRDEQGRQRIVRNGYLPEREIQTGIGQVAVRVPRSRDQQAEGAPIRYHSALLLPYLRRTRSIEELLPWLYLKGISTGDFSEALAALLGGDAGGFSPQTIGRLKAKWKEGFDQRRGLEGCAQLAALEQIYPETKWQQCWVHKMANVLNKLPKGQQSKAKKMLHEIWMASSKEEAEKSFDLFIELCGAKYPKAVECLEKDREVLLTFYDFPAEHWRHIRTTNPIESTFATVRLRTDKVKSCFSSQTVVAMAFQLCRCAEKQWHKIDGVNQLPKVINGIKFVDGIEEDAA